MPVFYVGAYACVIYGCVCLCSMWVRMPVFYLGAYACVISGCVCLSSIWVRMPVLYLGAYACVLCNHDLFRYLLHAVTGWTNYLFLQDSESNQNH